MIKSKIFKKSLFDLWFFDFELGLQLNFIEFEVNYGENVRLGVKLELFSLFMDFSSCDSKLRLSWIDYRFLMMGSLDRVRVCEGGKGLIEKEKVIARH